MFYLREQDSPRRAVIYDAARPFPPARPVAATRDEIKGAPWIEATEQEYADALAATNTAFLAWVASHPAEPPPAPPAVIVQSPDGSHWRLAIDNTGALGRAVKV